MDDQKKRQGLLLVVLWLGLCSMGHAANNFLSFPEVQHNWQSSYASLLDRHGHVLTRQRINKEQHRLDWTFGK